MVENNHKLLEYYLNLPWTYEVKLETSKSETYYVVRVKELPGCCTDGKTIEEAFKNIKEALEGVLFLYLENCEEIPTP